MASRMLSKHSGCQHKPDLPPKTYNINPVISGSTGWNVLNIIQKKLEVSHNNYIPIQE